MDFGYGYPDFPCANNSIDDLDIPDECLQMLKRTGLEYIGDLLDVFARIHTSIGLMDGFPRMNAKCYAATVRALVEFGCWPWPEESSRWLEAD